jgi:hypothetical protein
MIEQREEPPEAGPAAVDALIAAARRQAEQHNKGHLPRTGVGKLGPAPTAQDVSPHFEIVPTEEDAEHGHDAGSYAQTGDDSRIGQLCAFLPRIQVKELVTRGAALDKGEVIPVKECALMMADISGKPAACLSTQCLSSSTHPR